MIRDKIVFSSENPALKKRLLREPELSLEKAVDISRLSELAHKDLVGMRGAEGSDEQEVDALVRNRANKPRPLRGGKQPRSRGPGGGSEQAEPHTCEMNGQLGEGRA